MIEKPIPAVKFCPYCGGHNLKWRCSGSEFDPPRCMDCRCNFHIRFGRWIRKSPGALAFGAPNEFLARMRLEASRAACQIRENALLSFVPEGKDPVEYLTAHRCHFALQQDREFLALDGCIVGEFTTTFSNCAITFGFTRIQNGQKIEYSGDLK